MRSTVANTFLVCSSFVLKRVKRKCEREREKELPPTLQKAPVLREAAGHLAAELAWPGTPRECLN